MSQCYLSLLKPHPLSYPPLPQPSLTLAVLLFPFIPLYQSVHDIAIPLDVPLHGPLVIS